MAKNKDNIPTYLSTYQIRDGTSKYGQLNKSIAIIGRNGVRNMDRNELKQVGLPIIREARKRIKLLEEAGMTDSPAYRAIKDLNIGITTSGKDISTIRKNVKAAYEFLHAKTSLVENAKEYSRWLDEHLGAPTTKEQRESIWDVIHRFEKTHPQHFINYGYDEQIKRIAKIAKSADFDVDRAYDDMVKLLEKEAELDIKGYDPEESERATPWFRQRSTNEY